LEETIMDGQPEAERQLLSVAAETSKRRGPPKWLWITIAAVVATLALGGGGSALAFSLYGQPAAAAARFCQNLKASKYDSAYGELSSKLQARYTNAQFRAALTNLDGAEGRVVSCAQAQGKNTYSYSFGSGTASFTAAITRERQGALQGMMRLVNERGGWKIDGLDTSLLGINLDALGALGAFCANLRTQAYPDVYALFDSAVQGSVSQADFVQDAQWRDQIDGAVTACALSGVATGATDASAHATLGITRAKLGMRAGAVTLAAAGGSWRLGRLGDALQGTPITPLRVGMTFCDAVSDAQWAAAYVLMADDIKQQLTQAQLAQDFSLQQYGLQLAGCTPDLSSYTMKSSYISYNSALKIVNPANGASEAITMTMYFVGSGADWLVDGWKFS
jgi:hypothetical protein